DCAFHAAGVNEIAIGVELSSRGDAQRYPGEYRGVRDKVTCQIHGHQFLAYTYTRAQLDSMESLGRAIARILPGLPQTFPVASDGELIWTSLASPREYAGYLGHYHVSALKWDPGPFDFKAFLAKIRSRTLFPVPISSIQEVPADDTRAHALSSALYDN